MSNCGKGLYVPTGLLLYETVDELPITKATYTYKPSTTPGGTHGNSRDLRIQRKIERSQAMKRECGKKFVINKI